MATKMKSAPPASDPKVIEGHPVMCDENASVLGHTAIGRDQLVISITRFHEKARVDIRRWYLAEDEDAWRPTKHGLRLDRDEFDNLTSKLEALTPQIVAALKA